MSSILALTHMGINFGTCGSSALRPHDIDRSRELRHLDVESSGERVELTLLYCIGVYECAQQGCVGGESAERRTIRLQIALVRGKEKSSLTRLRVRDVLENRLRRLDRSVRVENSFAGGPSARKAAECDHTEQQHDAGDSAGRDDSLRRGELHACDERTAIRTCGAPVCRSLS